MINLTRFESAEYKPSKRVTHCKNCDSMFGDKAVDWENGDVILPGQSRIVVSGGWGTVSRSLTLCPGCALSEAARLEGLAKRIRKAVNEPLNDWECPF